MQKFPTRLSSNLNPQQDIAVNVYFLVQISWTYKFLASNNKNLARADKRFPLLISNRHEITSDYRTFQKFLSSLKSTKITKYHFKHQKKLFSKNFKN